MKASSRMPGKQSNNGLEKAREGPGHQGRRMVLWFILLWIDSIGRARGTGLGGGHDEREQTLNQILAEMDGFAPYESVVVLAATNRPDVLDLALIRPGRFDRRVTLDLPQKEARRQILELHTKDMPLGDDVDLDMLAGATAGFAGADLKNLANEAAQSALSLHRPWL